MNSSPPPDRGSAPSQTAPPANAPAPEVRGPLPGCIIVGVCVTIFASLIVFSFWTGIRQSQAIDAFTDNEPARLPVARIQDEAVAAELDAGIATLAQASRQGTVTDLLIDSDGLNHLIATRSELAEMRGRLRVREIAGGAITCEISFPINRLPWQEGRRYLNGQLTLIPELADGEPLFRVTGIEVPGRDVPDWFQDQISFYHLMETFVLDETFQPYLRQLAAFRLEEDRLLIRTKGWLEGRGQAP